MMSSVSPFLLQPMRFSADTKQIQSPQPEKLALIIDKSRSIKQLSKIHGFLIRHGLESHPILNFKLQRSYSSLGYIKHSVALFNGTPDPNVYFYTALIQGHVINGLYKQALHFYVQMLVEGIEPNAFTMSTILKACTSEALRALHGHAHKFGFESDVYVRTVLVDLYAKGRDLVSARKLFDTMLEKSLVLYTAMVTGYVKNGDVDEARVLFDGMKDRDVVSWNVIIDGYAQHGRPNEALILFRQMLKAGQKPSEATMVAVLSACGQLGALESGQWIHSYLGYNSSSTARVGTALIDMYSKCGSLDDARKVFDAIKSKDVVAYNAMIGGYAVHGFSRDALNLFEEMIEVGLDPTDITFISILSACAHAGLVSEGRELFNAMKDVYGVEPKVEHYSCMVNLLGRAGHLEEAYELVWGRSFDSDPVMWGTLLAACRLHRNVALGEKIVDFLHDRGLANSGTYVLLSNMYATAGNWSGVARMRAMMKQSGVPKEPGCSSIEVNNRVHEFRAGEMKHPNMEEIYEMLEQMNRWLKAYGYVSQTEAALHDIEDAEKERSLEVHSEKLALAFGLVSTKPGTTIKIVKNLRVCPDCHAVIKLMSKITRRKIIMRDRNRFHHCANGSCSCGDYWFL
ncbi:pentatricopeptide repeat-containing protein ELI1, chloroplastic isoform X2 [Andrographis paniculata]|uniref:pentatricopeptide repeat-containing protein ELI1, chloroplastic isoform X2 n=2 Tax=Andrographis paniculata TaxID=175694 RepID=UPI0021E87C44|nr:pentatricopeptide repeat-containing protein ELI1, chloroplastic isoform X2 [Andrographis paniculata]